MLPRGNKRTANRQIAVRAFAVSRRSRTFETDKGGGGGRIGTRIIGQRPSKSDMLRYNSE